MEKIEINESIGTKWVNTKPTIRCSKLTIETLEQGMKYVQNSQ